MKQIKLIFGIFIACALLTFFQSCKKEKALTNEQIVENALNEFVADLQSNPPNTDNLSGRVYNYMQGKSEIFYGSTVTLLDSAGNAVISPYWFRQNNILVNSSNLMDTAYHIENQFWFRKPIDGGSAVWTEPYFDAGGGNIWMKTRAVPVYINGKIKAVATTDMAID